MTLDAKEAALWESIGSDRAQCHLCAHHCIIAPGGRGICQVRENRDGTLFTLVYGQVIARHVDPIEKKPLFHFYPGSKVYSVATPGCNFRCDWCQNWDISQMPRDQHRIVGEEVLPEEIVEAAHETFCRSIAYTYTEPTIFFEYNYDIALLARDAGLANLYVTNGFMTPMMLEAIHPFLDAANVDLKAFRDETYRRFVGARLQPVLDSLKLMKQMGVWVEVTTLIIPGLNDGPQELQDIAQFIALELGAETPWHVSRFFPAHKMRDVPPTPEPTLMQAMKIGKTAGLHYVYAGNTTDAGTTVCHLCGEPLVQRVGYAIQANHVTPDGRCPQCGAVVAGVGMASV